MKVTSIKVESYTNIVLKVIKEKESCIEDVFGVCYLTPKTDMFGNKLILLKILDYKKFKYAKLKYNL